MSTEELLEMDVRNAPHTLRGMEQEAEILRVQIVCCNDVPTLHHLKGRRAELLAYIQECRMSDRHDIGDDLDEDRED